MSRHARSRSRAAICALALGLFCALPVVSGVAAQAAGPAVGDEAPEIEVRWVQGETSLATLRRARKVVVLEFWATWCGPCRAVTPRLVELHGEKERDGLEIVAVSIENPGQADRVRAYVREYEMEYPVGMSSEIAAGWGVRGIPHAIVIDARGVVRWRGHPGTEGLRAAVDEALSERGPVRTAEERAADAAEAARIVELEGEAFDAAIDGLLESLEEAALAEGGEEADEGEEAEEVQARGARAASVLVAIGARARDRIWKFLDEVGAVSAEERAAVDGRLEDLSSEEYEVRETASRALIEVRPELAAHVLALGREGDAEYVARVRRIQEIVGETREAWLGSRVHEDLGAFLVEGAGPGDLDGIVGRLRERHALSPDLVEALARRTGTEDVWGPELATEAGLAEAAARWRAALEAGDGSGGESGGGSGGESGGGEDGGGG